MAYICLSCGEVFDDPHTYSEHIGEFWGTPAYDEFTVCPCCGNEAIRELDDETHDIYQLGYDTGNSAGKSEILQRFKLVQEYINKDMTADETIKIIGEWLNAKNVADLVRKYISK